MPLENGKWRVVKGDCLWNIAKSVYNNPYRWTEIADANGVSRSTALIYPGQVFTLPGITPGGSSPTTSFNPPAPSITKANIVWFKLQAGSEREMQAIWEYNHNRFNIRWEQWDANGHLWMVQENTNLVTTDAQKASSCTLKNTAGWNVCRFSVRPVDEDGNQLANTSWSYLEYDFRNNPPKLPPNPTFEIDTNNKLTVEFNNIDEDINGTNIEIAIYQDDTKYKTGNVVINKETLHAIYTCNVESGYKYKIRCRAVRGSIYGGWTNFTDSIETVPLAPSKINTLRPQVISEQQAKTYGVFVEWDEVKTAKTYEVEYTTNVEYFDSTSGVNKVPTEEGKGPRILISNIDPGHEYFFRVRSKNSKGNSTYWSKISSIKIGSEPSPPTTWSNTSSGVIGEDINLYWTHNSTDGSLERYARLHITVIDSKNPKLNPMEWDEMIENTKPEDEKDRNSVYTINTNDNKWSSVKDGFIIKWKVQTAGIAETFSKESVEREINVYAKPELSIDIQNNSGVSISEVNSFPFIFSILATPNTQTPISYYIEVIAKQGYEAVDNVGNNKIINPGDKVYQRYFDPNTNAWQFIIEMSPANIDLQNEIEYTVNVTVSMNSGLTAMSSLDFKVYFEDIFYEVDADITINKDTLEAVIHPYCLEYDEDGEQQFVEDCKLSVYRREYDGTFTEIMTDIYNNPNTYITDPHPSLDYARYRVLAKTNSTGAISYADIDPVKFGEPSIVIQWSEKWVNFDESNIDNKVEPPWSGSMLKLPYNITTSESNNKDSSLVSYIGRKRPVSYYGTQLGESSSWKAEIPKEDKETLYGIRRLSTWMGDVYVREPSGIGYWANINVSYGINYDSLVIPITFDIKRVEGGM